MILFMYTSYLKMSDDLYILLDKLLVLTFMEYGTFDSTTGNPYKNENEM